MKAAAILAPIEDLDHNILTLCTHLNVATYELLVLIREFDERVGWMTWGLKNCAQWLAWRCVFGMTTALEKVRVAHAYAKRSLRFRFDPHRNTMTVTAVPSRAVVIRGFCTITTSSTSRTMVKPVSRT